MKKILFTCFNLCFIFILCFSFDSFADSTKIYENIFTKPSGFSHTFECSDMDGEYHIFNSASGYLCWQDLKPTPEQAMIRTIIITQEPEMLESSQNSGLIFRIINLSNASLFTIYPKTKEYEFGYWQDKKWRSVKKESFPYIQNHINYLDLQLDKDHITAYINGEKAMEIDYPRPYHNLEANYMSNDTNYSKRMQLIQRTKYYSGYYSSKGFHSHFANFQIFQFSSPFTYTAPLMKYVPKAIPKEISAKTKPNYDDITDELFSYYFTSSKDSPFLENSNAHTENGKYILWNKGGYVSWNSQISHDNILTETKIRVKEEKSWAGLTLKHNKYHYYAFEINPYTSQARIIKNDNSKDTLLFESTVPNLKKGEGETNTIAFAYKEATLTAYINGVKIKSMEDPNPLSSNGIGLIVSGDGRAEFDYIQIYSLKRTFWESYSAWIKFFLAIFLIVLVIKFFKRRSKKEKAETTKDQIIKEVLQKMKDKKNKVIYDTDLIFNYQITKNEASEILTELSKDYGAYFDYDKDGRMYVTFDTSFLKEI